ncbi:MAG: hypothetical protein NDI94_06540, partial [Candidatus Woesearchaeota archaeon]|nr:hypothetical protein [Candidatus Woesearchaeota archaeon]
MEIKDAYLLLDEFIEEKEGKWNHDDWQALKGRIGIDENTLATLLEIEKQRYLAIKAGAELLDRKELISLCSGFIVKHDASWNHDDWLKLKEDVSKRGSFIELELGYLLEEQKKIFLENDHSFISEADALKKELARRDSHIAELSHLIASLKQQKSLLESQLNDQKALEEEIVRSKQKLSEEKESLEKNMVSSSELEKIKKDKSEIEKRYESLQKVKSLQRDALLLKDKAIDALNTELARLKSLSEKNLALEKEIIEHKRSKTGLEQKDEALKNIRINAEALEKKNVEQANSLKVLAEENKKLTESIQIKDSVLK